MKKSTVIAVLAFAALAFATYATLREKPERGITRVSFGTVDPARVTAIRISGKNAIELEKHDGRWTTGGKHADENAVKRMLEAVTAIESSNLVTNNPSRFADLEVEGDAAVAVDIMEGNQTVASFTAGKTGPGGLNVRVGDDVYAVRGAYGGTFSRNRSAWLDRTMFSDKVDAITEVDIKLSGQQPYTLVRDDEGWRLKEPAAMPAGQRFDAAAARAVVGSLANARAADILDEDPGPETTGLGNEADTFVLHVGKDAATRTLRLGGSGDSGAVYASASTRDDLLTVPAYLANNLRKKLADLRDLSLMKFDTKQATRLELVDGERRLVFENTGKEWQIADSTDERPDGFDLDSGLVRSRLARVAGMRAAEDAPEGSTATGLDSPLAQATVSLEDGSEAVLQFGNETTTADDRTLVFARGNADQRVYLVPKQARDTLFGDLQTFARRAPAGGLSNIDPKALEKLPPEVRDNLMRQLAEQQQRQKLVEQLEAKRKK